MWYRSVLFAEAGPVSWETSLTLVTPAKVNGRLPSVGSMFTPGGVEQPAAATTAESTSAHRIVARSRVADTFRTLSR